MEQEIFDEVEHWINFIKLWEAECDDAVPEQIILALETAMIKAVNQYKKQNQSELLENYINNSIH